MLINPLIICTIWYNMHICFRSTYFAGWLQCSLDQSGPDLVPLLGSNLPHHRRGHPAFLQPNIPTSRVARFSTFFTTFRHVPRWVEQWHPRVPPKRRSKRIWCHSKDHPEKAQTHPNMFNRTSERSIFKQKQKHVSASILTEIQCFSRS